MKRIEKRSKPEPGEPNSRPTATDAARRLVILKYVVGRALAAPPREIVKEWFDKWSSDARDEFTHFAEKQNKGFWQEFHDADWWQYFSLWEQQYASRTIVTMTHEEQVEASWRVEAVQVLMWALGLLSELPPYDEMADHDLLKSIPQENLLDLVASAKLRPKVEIERARDIAEFWHWRAVTQYLIESGEELEPDEKLKALGFHSYDEIVRFSASKGAEEGTIPPCIGDDFPARGKAYRDLTPEECSEVRSIAVQRHFTLNWLYGYAPGNRWDEIPTDT